MIGKIISGGQTGADRAALDFAIQHDEFAHYQGASE
ncbi:MAG: putative molybdenum carrier protein [Verrucomicrobiota bacterium]